MINSLAPTYYYKSIDLIDVDKLIEKGIKYILMDLDNTFTSFHSAYVSKLGLEFLNKCKGKDVKIIVISNNSKKRCDKFCKPLNLPYLHNAHKPTPLKTFLFLKLHKVDFKRAIFVGDQLYTDIRIAHYLRLKSILVEPIETKDLLVTLINRMRDRKLRNKLNKAGLLKGIE